jgi:putative endonuclease
LLGNGRGNEQAGLRLYQASRQNGTLHIGVTRDLVQWGYQHRNGLIDGFTKKYDCKILVWYQAFDDLDEA